MKNLWVLVFAVGGCVSFVDAMEDDENGGPGDFFSEINHAKFLARKGEEGKEKALALLCKLRKYAQHHPKRLRVIGNEKERIVRGDRRFVGAGAGPNLGRVLREIPRAGSSRRVNSALQSALFAVDPAVVANPEALALVLGGVSLAAGHGERLPSIANEIL